MRQSTTTRQTIWDSGSQYLQGNSAGGQRDVVVPRGRQNRTRGNAAGARHHTTAIDKIVRHRVVRIEHRHPSDERATDRLAHGVPSS